MRNLSERQRHLLRGIRREPGSTTPELAAFAGCDVGSAALSLHRLRRRRLVVSQGGCWRLT